MTDIEIKVGQVWGDCDPRRSNRYLMVKTVTDIRVALRNIRTGHASGVRRDRMKPGRKGYYLAMDPKIVAEVQRQIAEAEKPQPALFAGQPLLAAKSNDSRQQRVNGMRFRRSKGLRRGGNIIAVNELESLVDRGDRWQDLNRCTTELSTYAFGSVPGFTSKL